MTIKLIIFDLDQVIVETGYMHFNALNKALNEINPSFCISIGDDFKYLGTKPTKEKLKIISKLNGLPIEYYNKILELKKQYTLDNINSTAVNKYFKSNTFDIINTLKQQGYLVYLASNTNREFINLILEKTNLNFDNIICNTDVNHAKPHPEMYLKSFIKAGVAPHECLIFEDSITGQEAAVKSGAHIFPIENPDDLNIDDILLKITQINYTALNIKWKSNKIHVIIPIAGEGSRFKDAGYTTPKPLINVRNLPMVATVVRDLNIETEFTFIIKKEHDQQYNLSTMLRLISPQCNIYHVEGKQSGAATTILQMKKIINNDKHLLIVNGDQMWDWNANVFYHYITQSNIDGSIVVFEDKSRNPKWSFAKTDNLGYVLEVAEKQPISDLATAGIYYYNKGSDFVKYSEQMIHDNFRVNGEFYVAPVYNYAIRDGKKITTFAIDKFWPTGTPDELTYYLQYRLENNAI